MSAPSAPMSAISAPDSRKPSRYPPVLGSGIISNLSPSQTISIILILRTTLTWDPYRLLWFVWLVLISLLHVHGRKQELGRVGVDRPLHQLDVARHDEANDNLKSRFLAIQTLSQNTTGNIDNKGDPDIATQPKCFGAFFTD